MQRAVFLDRDGVLNRAIVRDGKPYPPADIAELEVLPDVFDALMMLRQQNFKLIVVTNQPDVARGTQTEAGVEQFHTALKRGYDGHAALPIDAFYVCYHDDADGCACRKPAPGMLVAAAQAYNLDLTRSFLVGDRWRDIAAGRRAGCTTLLIDYQYAEVEQSQPHVRVRSLHEAAAWIVTYQQEHHSSMKTIDDLRVKIFADGADKAGMLAMYDRPHIKGFTTNPTLMRKAGIKNYRAFAQDILQAIPDCPVSFEVFSDDFAEMERQAHAIASWGDNVYVKIPVTNTKREPSFGLVRRLSHAGVKINVTALMTLAQVREVTLNIAGGVPCFISVFAGRIADTGRDPVPIMAAAVALLEPTPNAQLIWASPRELLNVFQADDVGCHVITVTNDVLNKLLLVGKDLETYSLETVQMFYNDAQQAGYHL